jgi:mono/diheme cytochrome c family protein
MTVALVAGLLTMVSCGHTQIALPALPATGTGDTVALRARGEYIVRNVAVCGGCHAADPKRDVDGPLSGGMEFSDWRIGTARASNLTPDPATGLGVWSEPEIVRALRNGQRKDGRLLAPVMPYAWFHEMSDGDALAVARYLQSLPPVRNEVTQSPSVSFKLGKLFFLRPKPAIAATAPAQGETAEYGAYLAQHVGLCADCHTQRGGLQSAPDKSRLLAGMSKPPKDFPANPSNLTPDTTTGIGSWSESDFIRTLRTGVNPAGITLSPFMPWRENQRMSDADLRAIYRYLRTLPPIHNQVPRKAAPGHSP